MGFLSAVTQGSSSPQQEILWPATGSGSFLWRGFCHELLELLPPGAIPDVMQALWLTLSAVSEGAGHLPSAAAHETAEKLIRYAANTSPETLASLIADWVTRVTPEVCRMDLQTRLLDVLRGGDERREKPVTQARVVQTREAESVASEDRLRLYGGEEGREHQGSEQRPVRGLLSRLDRLLARDVGMRLAYRLRARDYNLYRRVGESLLRRQRRPADYRMDERSYGGFRSVWEQDFGQELPDYDEF